jgi:hypothetical protein
MNDLSRKRGRLGRDLEPQTLKKYLYILYHSVALVRQRSRVQIPAKASFFCKNEQELGFLRSDETLPKTVRFLPNSVRPTVLWSGKGVHIWQPVESIILEQESKFAQFDRPSQTFLKFAAQYLSNHKSDTNNNPAFKSCLLRVPDSYNSKYNEQSEEIAEVKSFNAGMDLDLRRIHSTTIFIFI